MDFSGALTIYDNVCACEHSFVDRRRNINALFIIIILIKSEFLTI